MSNSQSSSSRPVSPCTGECDFDGTAGRCRTCHRTLTEIANWTIMSAQQKEAVWRRIERSLAAIGRRPGPQSKAEHTDGNL